MEETTPKTGPETQPKKKRRRPRKPKVIGPGQKFARQLLIGVMHGLFLLTRSLRFANTPAIEQPCVMAVFHDELLALCQHYRHQDITTIASQNHFGYAIAKALENNGYEVALGSPSRGGQDAFFQLLRAARKGRTVAFTVDGSRGPRHEMKPGAVVLARKAGLPLYLVRVQCRGWRIGATWDKFKIPHPFSTATFYSERFPLENYDEGVPVEDIVKDAEKGLVGLLADDYRGKT